MECFGLSACVCTSFKTKCISIFAHYVHVQQIPLNKNGDNSSSSHSKNNSNDDNDDGDQNDFAKRKNRMKEQQTLFSYWVCWAAIFCCRWSALFIYNSTNQKLAGNAFEGLSFFSVGSFDIQIGSSIIYFESVWLFIAAFFCSAVSLSACVCVCMYVVDGCFFLICSHSFWLPEFWHKFKLNWMCICRRFFRFIRVAAHVTFKIVCCC